MRSPNNFDYTSKDYESFRASMLSGLTNRMPEYTDHSQTDAGIVLLELFAMCLDVLSYYQDNMANETLLPTAELRSSILKWCNILSYNPRQATPSKVKQVFKLIAAQKDTFVIPKNTILSTSKGDAVEEAIYFETLEDLIIPSGKLGDEQEDGEYLYTVDAIQGISIFNELLGSSTGAANQFFKLKYTPVLQDSVEVLVNSGIGFEKWTRVPSFIDSLPTSKHFTVNINDNDEATITFGNGNFGMIPPIYENGIFCNYRTGGGSQGNVGANKITVIESPLGLVDSTFNPYPPYERGEDKETVDSIKVNAPNAHRVVWGALTIEDFKDIVLLNIPEVKLADSVTKSGDKYSVVIYALPVSGELLTEDVKLKILNLFDKEGEGRNLAGMNTVEVKDAILTGIDFTGDLIVKDTFKVSDVENQIREYLVNYFKLGNYNFNADLSLTELSSNIMNPSNGIEGIKSFKFTLPSDSIMKPETGVIYKFNGITFNSTGGVT